ncbi:MAG TPA: bifunctional aspartate kinase/homoserine dehydrogenase I [Parasegetibacter sp.]
MQVLKFGGSSMADANSINKVIAVIQKKQNQGKIIVVVSAMSGVTDKLIQSGMHASNGNEEYRNIISDMELKHLTLVRSLMPVTEQSSLLSRVKQLINELESVCDGVFILRELSISARDRILAFGELLSSLILTEKLKTMNFEVQYLDSRNLIKTKASSSFPSVDIPETYNRINSSMKYYNSKIWVAPGFIASNEFNRTTTLGRGGSDFSAALYAAAVNAQMLEIWSDASGLMTADPRLVSNARTIAAISYHEAMELSHFGAKIIYPPTLQPVMTNQIPLRILNTFDPEHPGTLIQLTAESKGELIKGISCLSNITMLTMEGSGMIGIPGFSARLFQSLADADINVILITQSSSEHSISVAISDDDTAIAVKKLNSTFQKEISDHSIEPIKAESDLSIVALVGDKMKSHPGISGRMFAALGRNGINIRAIAQGSSEKNISAVVATGNVRKAVNTLHEAFFNDDYKQINLFIAGTGNVGARFIDLIREQYHYLRKHLRLQVRILGIANSRKMIVQDEGISLNSWKAELEKGTPMNIADYLKEIESRNVRNCIFIDNTASREIASVYPDLLRRSVSVVACNKIGCSSDFQYYQLLRSLADEYNARFLFGTNVGAGLPVISTLNDLIRSGDVIHSIEAVLSGSLNFIFNRYNATIPFADVVKMAAEYGLTEPDPRSDLKGLDVKRKILILSRESGYPLELEDISCESFLPDDCLNGDLDNFYYRLRKHEPEFQKLYQSVFSKGKKLRYVAKLENGKASVGLTAVDNSHEAFSLQGKDNIVLFYTNRYSEQPLVIKGAGAGADVTASGVFGDMVKIAGKV